MPHAPTKLRTPAAAEISTRAIQNRKLGDPRGTIANPLPLGGPLMPSTVALIREYRHEKAAQKLRMVRPDLTHGAASAIVNELGVGA